MFVASREFLLLFIPLSLFAYHRLAKTTKYKNIVLLTASYIFYALAGIKFVPVLLSLSLFTYWAGLHHRFGTGIIVNLAALVLFKYWNFGLENLNTILSYLDIKLPWMLQIGLPLGISFFVFKHIGYLLDVQQKRYPASSQLLYFLTYSAYFPQISSGPLSRYKDTAEQFEKPEPLTDKNAYEGLVYLSLGLAKKLLLADTLAGLVSDYSSLNQISRLQGFFPSWYLVLAYSMQLYFDFSGYVDIVLGISKLFGIQLPQNFNNPYLASNPSEFWERWHISLSMWFRTYLFFPISRSLLSRFGNARRQWAQYAANLITMSLVGLWHGASWMFILWGAYHGALLSIYAWWKQRNTPLPKLVTQPLMLVAIFIGWAIFMSPSVAYLKHLLFQMSGLGGPGTLKTIQKLMLSESTPALLTALLLAFSGRSEAVNLLQETNGLRAKWVAIGLGMLAFFSILLSQANIEFIYAQF